MIESALGSTELSRRLAALVSEEEVAILNELYERLDHYSSGVDGERFRIDHKNSRQHIGKLTGRFIKEEFEPKRTYRPTLLALPLMESKNAREALRIADDTIRYMAAEYEREPGRPLTLLEISKHLGVDLARVADAMGYLIATQVSGSRRTGLPNAPDWYIVPGEQMLDYPDLTAVMKQLIEWAERSASPPPEDRSGDPAPGLLERGKAWVMKNKILSAILALFAVVVAITGFLADAASVLSFFGQFLT